MRLIIGCGISSMFRFTSVGEAKVPSRNARSTPSAISLMLRSHFSHRSMSGMNSAF